MLSHIKIIPVFRNKISGGSGYYKLEIAVLINFCLFIFTNNLFAQYEPDYKTQVISKIEIIARPFRDSILLRWAPDNSLLWEDANKSGYLLERVTLMREGRLLVSPERKLLTPSPLLPLPLFEWERAVKRNKYAAIAGQSLYGETFELKNNDAFSVITKIKERDTRFSFALFAADQSSEVAKLSGLWYTDKDVKNDEKYLYRIYVADNKVRADTGFVYTGPSEYQPLPRPIDLRVEFADRKADLTWNYRYFKNIYIAYILERSEDGTTFIPVSPDPLVNLTSSESTDPELFFKTDSLPENNRLYHYRVKGINSFGEISDPSDTVSGSGHPAISFTPYITENYSTENNRITLQWEFPSDKNHEIIGFKLARSLNPGTGFMYIEDKIKPESREYTDTNPLLTNYYIISAINSFGDEVRSSPVLVQLTDSIAPQPPVQLTGMVDSTGKVTLCWKSNSEEDIFGYRIYRSNYAMEEFSQITSAPVRDTCFSDEISVKTLTKSVFYRLMAIDQKQNHSDFSEPLELRRPDKIPPVSAVFTAARSSQDGVYLEWINSTSPDVKSHFLYRNLPYKDEWMLIAVFDSTETSFIDKEADSISYSSYTIIAADFDNNESKPATPVKGKKIDNGIRQGIKEVFTSVDSEKGTVKLAWKMPGGSVYRYLVYRSKGDNEMTLYKSIAGTENTFTDNELQINSRYLYSIKVVYADGSQSVFTKPVIIDY